MTSNAGTSQVTVHVARGENPQLLATFLTDADELGHNVEHPWFCKSCGERYSLEDVGIGTSGALIGLPMCPAEDCNAAGWDEVRPISGEL